MTPIEAVARAIAFSKSDEDWDKTNPSVKTNFRERASAAIAAYKKAVSGDAVGIQFRAVFFDGTHSDWTSVLTSLPRENRSRTETRPVFAAPQPAVPEGWSTDPIPQDGSVVYIQTVQPYRFMPYNPKSQQFKLGIKGRWQMMNEYGGWDNCPHPLGHKWRRDLMVSKDEVPQPALPVGWKLVPLDPIEDMLIELCRPEMDLDEAKKAYADMLAAVPEPEGP